MNHRIGTTNFPIYPCFDPDFTHFGHCPRKYCPEPHCSHELLKHTVSVWIRQKAQIGLEDRATIGNLLKNRCFDEGRSILVCRTEVT